MEIHLQVVDAGYIANFKDYPQERNSGSPFHPAPCSLAISFHRLFFKKICPATGGSSL
jgi:hypothetical protein